MAARCHWQGSHQHRRQKQSRRQSRALRPEKQLALPAFGDAGADEAGEPPALLLQALRGLAQLPCRLENGVGAGVDNRLALLGGHLPQNWMILELLRALHRFEHLLKIM